MRRSWRCSASVAPSHRVPDVPATAPRIRPFAQGDQDAARRLVLAGLGEHFGFIDTSYNPDLDDIQANYVAVGHVFVVADLDGELVGTAGLIVGEDGVGQMVRVSVARAQRRAGIGRALVSHLLAVARERGLNRVWMETNADWADALGLYHRCGFVEYERHDGLVFLALDLR
jgi:ribosomal protein S18 acetylase RimI-like enzyme